MNIALTNYFPQIGDSEAHLDFLKAARSAPATGVALASAARTAVTVSSYLYNPGCSRLLVCVNITVWTAGSVYPKLQPYLPTIAGINSSLHHAALVGGAAGTWFYLFGTVGTTASTNADMIPYNPPAQFKLAMIPATADSITYSVDYHWIP